MGESKEVLLPKVSPSYPDQLLPLLTLYLSVFVIEEKAVVLQHKPPLPPALHEAGVSPLMQVTPAGGPWGIRAAADVGSHNHSQDVWTYRHEFGRVQ